MERVLTIKEYERITNEYEKVKYLCKVIIPKWVEKQLCDWCGNYVFKSKEDEFKFRLKEKMNVKNINSKK